MKPELTIVGGFYREVCQFPPNDDFWGSGGRAAAAVSEIVTVRFITVADEHAQVNLDSIAAHFGFEIDVVSVPLTITFRYLHGLSKPATWPALDVIKRRPLTVSGACVLQFGMLDAEPDVNAETVIYDPQNPLSPEHFRSSRAPSRLAYVLNAREVCRLGENEDVVAAATNVRRASGAAVVVVKQDSRGALVCTEKGVERVPAYESSRVWPIGSGDVFAAVFAVHWGLHSMPASEAADLASRATAEYVDTRTLPIAFARMRSREPIQRTTNQLTPDQHHIYLAGPFFNMAQTWLVCEARDAMKAMALDVFSPLHDVGLGRPHDVASKDLAALEKCRAVFAIVDGSDEGTIFEIGFARARGIPVVAFAESSSGEQLTMIEGSGCDLVDDFVTAIYRTAWKALR